MAKQRERKTKPGVYKQAVAGVLLILTLLSAYFAGLACITPRRYRVAEGEPAPVTIHANQTMDDEGATESLRQSAMNGVQPVYQIDQALVETLEQGASGFFDSLTDVRAKALQQAAT